MSSWVLNTKILTLDSELDEVLDNTSIYVIHTNSGRIQSAHIITSILSTHANSNDNYYKNIL